MNERLTNEKERLSVTLQSIGDALLVTNERGEIVGFNEMAAQLTGLLPERALGLPLDSVVRFRDCHTMKPSSIPIKQVIEEGRRISQVTDIELLRSDGSVCEIVYSCAPIQNRDIGTIGCVLAMRDMSDWRRMQEEAAQSRKLESIGLLAGGIAHDFNNFLTAILVNLSLAQEITGDSRELQELLAESADAAKRAEHLTKQLLTFSKGGAPVRKMASRESRLRPADDSVGTCGVRGRGSEEARKGLRVLVMDDEEMIRRALTKTLRVLGHEASAAVDGQEAVDCVRAMLDQGLCFDVVILDLTVPGGKGGNEVVSVIKKLDSRTHIIATSGYSEESGLAGFKQSGFDGVLQKPYTRKELIDALSGGDS